MEETIPEKKMDYIKVLNPEKVLEFKYNESTGLDEAEIIIENICQENIISKIYINNYSYFKCVPNITIINKNSSKKIKVIKDDKKYEVSDSDVFLIISHPVNDNNAKDLDEKNLNEFFKKNSFKEDGQKVFMIGYKKEIECKKSNDDELIKKIKELEKQVYDQKEEFEESKKEKINKIIDETKKEKINKIIDETKETGSKNYNIVNYICISLLVLGGSFLLYKLFKKNK